MVGCSAPHCGYNTANRDKDENISTHKIPSDPKIIRTIYINNLVVSGKKNRAPNQDIPYTGSKHENLCSQHFMPHFIDKRGIKSKLKKGAVATEFKLSYTTITGEKIYTRISTSMIKNKVCVTFFFFNQVALHRKLALLCKVLRLDQVPMVHSAKKKMRHDL
jgi:hypothetical protein